MYGPFNFELEQLYSLFPDDAAGLPTVYVSSIIRIVRILQQPQSNGIDWLKSATLWIPTNYTTRLVIGSALFMHYDWSQIYLPCRVISLRLPLAVKSQVTRQWVTFAIATETGDSSLAAWFWLSYFLALKIRCLWVKEMLDVRRICLRREVNSGNCQRISGNFRSNCGSARKSQNPFQFHCFWYSSMEQCFIGFTY